MPTYEYRCRACNHRFEAVQSMKDEPIAICPQCGKPEVERVISAGGGILFKGSGFYITDYRKDSYKSDAKKDTKPESKSDSAKESKSDSSSTSPAKPSTESKPSPKPTDS